MIPTRTIHNGCLRRKKSKGNKIYFVILLIVLVRPAMSDFEGNPFSKEEECGLSQKDQENIVYLHRKLRGEVCGANMMPFMGWNEDAAKMMYKHAKKCNFIYPIGIKRTDGFDGGRTSNTIAANVDKDKDFLHTIEHIWYRPQKKKYCFGNLTTKSVEEFGDYAQIVWSNTKSLGCGRYWCDSLKGFEGGKAPWFDVCRYGAGMTISPWNGRDDLVPFKRGKPCSKCPKQFANCCNGTCFMGPENSLCLKPWQKDIGERQCEDSQAEDCETTGNNANGNNDDGNNQNGNNPDENGPDENGNTGKKDASRAPGLPRVCWSLLLLPLVTAGNALLMCR